MAEKKSKKKDLTAEEAAKEMEIIVEAQQAVKEEAEKQRLIKIAEEADKQKQVPYSPEEAEKKAALDNWVPKTELGKLVMAKKVKSIDEILDSGRKILEPEIVDTLLNVKTELMNIGQAKGKFGGGKRRSWRQTQKKTEEGNILTFSVLAVVGDGNGHVGIGFGRASETLPAKEKAIRKAKLNLVKVRRGCASYDCSCKEMHSIPISTEGKCSSVIIRLFPAPQGAGLVVGDEIKKILRLAGIQDVYGKSKGKTRTTLNVAKATLAALMKLDGVKE
jgi:small subunit ribosomal protein S5